MGAAATAGDPGLDGWARGWTDAAKDAVQAIRKATPVAHIATHLVDRVRGTLRPQKGADAAAYVRQLGARLRPFAPAVLARTAEVLLDTRGGYLPDAATVERTARAVESELRHAAEAVTRREARAMTSPAADPALAARWPELRAALTAELGEKVVASWLDGLVLASLANGVLTVTAEVPFKARWIAQHHEPALLAAARQALGPVSRVVVRSAAPTPAPHANGAAA